MIIKYFAWIKEITSHEEEQIDSNEINNLDKRLWSEDKTAHMIKTPQIFLFNDLKVDNTKLVDLIKLCF